MTNYIARNLTVEETASMVRKLHVELGRPTAVDTALRVIASMGLGIFVAEQINLGAGDRVRTHSGRVGEVLDIGQQGELAIVSLEGNSIEALPVAALKLITPEEVTAS